MVSTFPVDVFLMRTPSTLVSPRISSTVCVPVNFNIGRFANALLHDLRCPHLIAADKHMYVGTKFRQIQCFFSGSITCTHNGHFFSPEEKIRHKRHRHSLRNHLVFLHSAVPAILQMAPVAMITESASISFSSSIHTLNGRPEKSTLVARPKRISAPMRDACFSNSTIISGPCTPSG